MIAKHNILIAKRLVVLGSGQSHLRAVTQSLVCFGLLSRRRVDARKVDVYAFGIMLGFMLNKRRPWTDDALQMPLAR